MTGLSYFTLLLLLLLLLLSFQALLSGLCVMTPEFPRLWIAEKLRSLYDIGFINLDW